MGKKGNGQRVKGDYRPELHGILWTKGKLCISFSQCTYNIWARKKNSGGNEEHPDRKLIILVLVLTCNICATAWIVLLNQHNCLADGRSMAARAHACIFRGSAVWGQSRFEGPSPLPEVDSIVLQSSKVGPASPCCGAVMRGNAHAMLTLSLDFPGLGS